MVSVIPFMGNTGAMQDPDLIYQYGRLVGKQCRMGITVNAPVVDINNNADNPVINKSLAKQEQSSAIRSLLTMNCRMPA
jgi:beta-glucosidase-like glycosyl hydrolase